jgi:phosphoribosylanthranilate isomerase
MILQIYEIQRPEEAEKLIQMEIDHIGSVLLSEDSWKDAGVKDVVELVRSSDSKSSIIPLFNHDAAVFRAIDYYSPDIIHLCDDLTKNDVDDLIGLQKGIRKRFPNVKITRSIPIAQKGFTEHVATFEFAARFEGESDYFMIDTLLIGSQENTVFQDKVDCGFGITGKICDWDMAAELVKSSRVPVILAGGVSPENVREAVEKVHPFGIDSCTMTNERAPDGKIIRFKKDFDKVKQLIDATR